MSHDPTNLPDRLPRPRDDGEADHLPGTAMPALALASTSGRQVRVDSVPAGFERLVIYAYPMTGRPGVELPAGWDEIPGARGCTSEACGFRDHAAELANQGAAVVGVSTQSTPYQQDVVKRLRLPFPLLSDSRLELAQALSLPTFDVELPAAYEGGGKRALLKRLTFVVNDSIVEHVFYPVFPPDRHAPEVLAWLGQARHEGQL